MKSNKSIIITMCIVLIFSLVACTSPTQSESSPVSSQSESSMSVAVKNITAAEAAEMIEDGDVIIVDVRTKEEYDEGHIPNAILLTDSDIPEKAEDVLEDKDSTLLVYCRSGNRSATASKALVELGYTNVYDFGGINDWQGEVVK